MVKARKIVRKVTKASKANSAFELTINLHKRLSGVTNKKRAPRAIEEIKKSVQKALRVNDVRVDMALNKFIWSKGVDRVPYKVRVFAKSQVDGSESRKRYAVVSHIALPNTFIKKSVKDKSGKEKIVVVPQSSAQRFRGSYTIKTNVGAARDE